MRGAGVRRVKLELRHKAGRELSTGRLDWAGGESKSRSINLFWGPPMTSSSFIQHGNLGIVGADFNKAGCELS